MARSKDEMASVILQRFEDIMPSRALFRIGLLSLLLLAGTGLCEATAQNQWGGSWDNPRQGNEPQRGNQPQQQGDSQAAQQQAEGGFIDGLTIGAGLGAYQGDISRNPNNNLLKYVGTAKLTARVGVDHRMGTFEQYGVGADLVYTRIGGITTGLAEFNSNLLALDFYGDYELPYVMQGLFRVFLGGGPMMVISPTYSNFPENNPSFKKLGTRVVGSFKVGVTILDRIRVGARVSTSDYIDGYEGFYSGGIPDTVGFVTFNYRFDLSR